MSNTAVIVSKTKEKSYRRKLRMTRTYRVVVCIFFCLLSLFPFYTVIINSTLDTSTIQSGINVIPGDMFSKNWDNFIERATTNGMDVSRYFINSAIIAFSSTMLAVYFSTMTAYGIHVYNFKMKKAAWTFILGIMMIPVQVSMVGFVRMMISVNLNDTYVPIIIPALAAPSTVFFMRQYMKTGLPLEIVEAARIDGSGELRTFNAIAMPLMKPAIATQAIFAFILSWNNLYTPSMFITSSQKITLPMFVEKLTGESFKTDYGVVYMGIFITILPLLVVYMILSKYIIAGVALGGVKE